jgi:hypothetical protein
LPTAFIWPTIILREISIRAAASQALTSGSKVKILSGYLSASLDTTSGTESIVPGNKVLVTAGYAGGGTAGRDLCFFSAPSAM